MPKHTKICLWGRRRTVATVQTDNVACQESNSPALRGSTRLGAPPNQDFQYDTRSFAPDYSWGITALVHGDAPLTQEVLGRLDVLESER